MPWSIEKRGDQWCVVKDDDGDVEGCHDSEAKAKRQQRALYASEEGQSAKRTSEVASFGVELSNLELHSEKGRRIMVGHASAFNYPIPEYDGGTTFFDPGAWKRTLKNNGDQIQVLYHHGMDPQIGEKPLGVPRVIHEDNHGLWTETPLASTQYNSEVIIPLLESGALRSMSVQFAAIASQHASDGRHITEAALKEFGPTPFPRNLGASAALHSHSLAEFLATGGDSPNILEENQPEAPGDPARLTWETEAASQLLAWQHQQDEIAAWLTQGGTRGHTGAGQGPPR